MADVRQAQVELGGGREQRLLVAEVAHHHRRVDGGRRGDRADRRRLVSPGGELLRGGPQDRRLGGIGSARRRAIWTHETIVCQHLLTSESRSPKVSTIVGKQLLTSEGERDVQEPVPARAATRNV